MKYRLILPIALLGVSLLFVEHAQAAENCPSSLAKVVEEKLDNVQSWEDFARMYRLYGVCDQPALSDSFTQAIVRLASSPEGLTKASYAIEHHRWLRQIVLKHLSSDSVNLEDLERIEKSAEATCPTGKRKLCSEVLRAVRH